VRHAQVQVDLLQQEEKSRATAAAENGEANLLTEDINSQTMPPPRNCHGEHRFQKLLKPSPTARPLQSSLISLPRRHMVGQ
jgi:hypothetical protein